MLLLCKTLQKTGEKISKKITVRGKKSRSGMKIYPWNDDKKGIKGKRGKMMWKKQGKDGSSGKKREAVGKRGKQREKE